MNLILLLFTSVITGNIALSYFLGMCPFVSISKNFKVAIGMGMAVTFVMTVTAAVNNLLFTYILTAKNLQYLEFLVFIVTIAFIVQLLEKFIDRYSPGLYASFGIFLPLITVNCAILGVSQIMSLQHYSFIQTLIFAFGSGIGWLLAITAMGALRKKLAFSRPLKNFGKIGVTAVLAGIMAMTFIGFAGVGVS